MAYFIDERTLEEIKERADIVSVISQYIDLKKAGANYKGLCPFHGEKTPSFTVSPQKKIYKCFGCGEGGNVINFVMKMEGLSFPEACKKLGDEYGVTIQAKNNIDDSYKESLNIMYQINRELAVYYMKNLVGSKEALTYLKNRNMTTASIKKFGIGYSKDSWNDVVDYLKSLNYDLELAHKAGAIGKNKSGNYFDYYKNRVIFPIIDTKSRVLGFGARALKDEIPKYINTSDSPIFNKGKNIYGLNRIDKHKKVSRLILVEGYVDVISLDLNGVEGAIASLGTAFTVDQANLLRKYTDNLYISYDGDKAGREATKRALNVLHSIDWDGQVVSLPNGIDPDNFVNQYGSLKYEAALKNSKSGYKFLIEDYKNSLDLDSIEDQVKLIKFIGQIIKKIKSPIERELQMKKLSEDFDISISSLKTEIFGNGYQNFNDTIKKPKVTKITRALSQKDRDIIEIFRLMMHNKDLNNEFSSKISEDLIENTKLREVYKSIKSTFEDKEAINKDSLLTYLLDNYIIDKVLFDELSKDILEFSGVNKFELVDEMVSKLKENDSIQSRKEIVNKIRKLEQMDNKSEDEIKLLRDLISKLVK